ncbi:MAG: hypothetical protein AAGI12_01915 [Pseudomonadota bacterium]
MSKFKFPWYHPARIVLCCSIFASQVWFLDLIEAAKQPVPDVVLCLYAPTVAFFALLKLNEFFKVVTGHKVAGGIDAIATAWQIATSGSVLWIAAKWYAAPAAEHLEPLFILATGSIAGMEFCRREAARIASNFASDADG